MAKEIIGFINKNNDIFNLKEDPSTSKYCHKVGQGHENKIATFTEDGDLKDSEYEVEDFAQAEHSHSQLILPATLDPTEYNRIDLEETEHQGKIYIRLYDTEDEDSVFSDYITGEKLSNIFYPATAPVQGNQKLITSDAVYTALQGKVDKVENAITGNLASLDADGNLQDSGKKPTDFVSNIPGATEGNIPTFDENGNLQDSGHEPSDFALSDHEHNYIANFSGYDSCGASVSVGEGDQGEGVISMMIKGDGGGSVSKTVEIDYYKAANLQRALEDPVKNSDPDSAYNDNKLITASAVMKQCSNKLGKPYNSLMVEFNVSGGALTLLEDTTKYDDIFALVTPGVTVWDTVFVGIYNSNDDVYIPFLGVASVDGHYSNIDGTLEEISVTIYVGGYTIHLNKNVPTNAITVSMDSFAALLQGL